MVFLIFIIIATFFLPNVTFAEEPRVIELEKIVVTPTKTERNVFQSPQAVSIVTEKEVDRENPISIVDTLDDKIGIWVEKRTSEASDPIMRGFAGYYILALIDGNTLSTLAGEGGPAGSAMYGKIDPLSIKRIEVTRGPSSVLYGTNTIAGVINFITKDPIDYSEKEIDFEGSEEVILGSAAETGTTRTEINMASPNLRFLLGITYQNIEDVEGGGDLGTLKPSSAQRLNYDLKSEYKLSNSQYLNLAVQDVRIYNHRRYYYEHEKSDYVRQGFVLGYRFEKPTYLWDSLNTEIYHQNKESTTRNRNNVIGNIQHKDTETYTLDFKFLKLFPHNHKTIYGIHYEKDDFIKKLTKASTGATTKTSPDATWTNLGMYIQDEWGYSRKLTFIPAIRYDHYLYDSDPDDMFDVPTGFSRSDFDVLDREDSFTGGLGLVYALKKGINLTGYISRGFRQPKPSLGVKKFSYGVSVPSTGLSPEVATTYEVGLKVNQNKFEFLGTVYYTDLKDFLTTERSTFNGKDWFDWNDNGSRDAGEDVYKKKNSGNAWVSGIEIESRAKLNLFFPEVNEGWFVSGGLNWMDGYDESAEQPLSKLSPTRGILKLGYKEPAKNKYWFEFSADMVRSFDDIPDSQRTTDPAFRSDPQDMTSSLLIPVPGYTVFDIKGGYKFSKSSEITLAIENLTDKKYRTKDSRMDAPGINFKVSYKQKF